MKVIAARPSAYKDVAGLGQWLAEIRRLDVETVIDLLQPMRAAARQRAAYLLSVSHADDAATIVDAYRPKETAWLGPRTPGGLFDARTKVNDTLLADYINAGTGS
jgi:hypothetical protein